MGRVHRSMRLLMRVDGRVMKKASKYEIYSDVSLAHLHLINHCNSYCMGFHGYIPGISYMHAAYMFTIYFLFSWANLFAFFLPWHLHDVWWLWCRGRVSEQVKANPRLRSAPPWRSEPPWRYAQTRTRYGVPDLTNLHWHTYGVILKT